MEGLEILEQSYVTSEQIKRPLPVLKQHPSTVHVKVSTDCQAFFDVFKNLIRSTALTLLFLHKLHFKKRVTGEDSHAYSYSLRRTAISRQSQQPSLGLKVVVRIFPRLSPHGRLSHKGGSPT